MRSYLVATSAIFLLIAGAANAQTCTAFPTTLTNGNTADATQVMGNFNYLSGCLAPLASPSFTGNVGIGTTTPGVALDVNGQVRANETYIVNGASGTSRLYAAETGGIARWVWGADPTLESGSNMGSNFVIVPVSDSGVQLNTNFIINRATGNIGIGTEFPG